MIFSVLIVLGILLLVGCVSAVGHIMLSARQHLSKEQLDGLERLDDLPPGSQVQVPAGTTTTLPTPESRMAVITAQPSVRFVDGGPVDEPPIPHGTILLREGEGRWVGGHRIFTDSEIQRLVTSGYAIERSSPSVSSEGVQRYNQGIRDALVAAQATPSTQSVRPSPMDSFERMQRDMMQSFERPMQDFQRIMSDFLRVMPGPGTSINSNVTVTRSTVGNSRPSVPDTRPEPAAKAAPKPKPNTPKRAIDRLLEDDLISDDDSGVKPGS